MRCFVVRGKSRRPVHAGHPWVFAANVHEVAPRTDVPFDEDEDVVLVVDEGGEAIGRGLLSETSAIRIRLLDRGHVDTPVPAVLESRVREACALRRRFLPRPAQTNTYRLVHAEGDLLPGLVVDRYADVLVAQFATRPMFRRREALASALLRESGATTLVAREGGFEAEEGIDVEAVPFHAGGPVPERVRVREEGMLFDVEPGRGQKTGHYTDQRENRLHVGRLAAGARVLDLYAGTGGFSVQALRHGATSSLAVESSKRAVAAAGRTATLNAVGPDLEVLQADVRHVLQDLRARGERFDVVVADPPNFFPRKGGEGHARKAYRELNVRAMTRVTAGGLLATFSCSSHFDAPLWRDLVLAAARECRRPIRVFRELAAGPDHPVVGAAPEGRYLTGLLLAVDAPLRSA